MGLYQEQLLPRFQDKVMSRKATRVVRARVCAGLRGRVVEVGFGTGLNVPYCSTEVREVLAVEPSRVCMRLAAPRIAKSPVPVRLAGLNGEHLELPSGEFDAVLSTWTLCTIPDLSAALGEMRRVLKPGGTFRFVEHGHAPDARVARWQARVEPLNRRLAGGASHTPILRAYRGRGVRPRATRHLLLQGRAKIFMTPPSREEVLAEPMPCHHDFRGAGTRRDMARTSEVSHPLFARGYRRLVFTGDFLFAPSVPSVIGVARRPS